MYTTITHTRFYLLVVKARYTDAKIWDNVYLYSINEYADMTCYYDYETRSGFAIKGSGELVSVHSLSRGAGSNLVAYAVQCGAKFLDCFDGYLVTLYGKYGFKEVQRTANFVAGKPDVVYMERD